MTVPAAGAPPNVTAENSVFLEFLIVDNCAGVKENMSLITVKVLVLILYLF